MWIVKNKLRATLTLRGLGVSIASGAEFDLDAIGRTTAESSPQVTVAFEEGYLENVFKQPGAGGAAPARGAETPRDLLTAGEFNQRLESFKAQFLNELKAQIPGLEKLDKLELAQAPKDSVDLKAELENVRKAIASDMREVVGDIKVAREKIEAEKRRILSDASLSQHEIKARIAFLEEKERELAKNFESVGRTVEMSDGDVQDKADLLADL